MRLNGLVIFFVAVIIVMPMATECCQDYGIPNWIPLTAGVMVSIACITWAIIIFVKRSKLHRDFSD